MSDIIDPRLIGQPVIVTYDHEFRNRYADLGISQPVPIGQRDGFSATILGVTDAGVTIMTDDGRMFRWDNDLVIREFCFKYVDDVYAALSTPNGLKKPITRPC